MRSDDLLKNTGLTWTAAAKGALGATTCVLGMVGFMEVYRPADLAGYVDCTFKTIQLLFAQFPPAITAPPGKESVAIPLSLNIARFAMPILFVWLAASALVRRIRQPLRAARASVLEDHLIFAGEGDRVTELLKRARRLKRSCVVISPVAGSPLALLAQTLGAAVVTGDPGDPGVWRRAGLKRASSALILGLDDAPAVAAALAVAEAARLGRAAGGDPVKVVCSVQDPDLRSLAEGAFRGRVPLPCAALQINSPAEIQARRLLQRHPLYRGADVQACEQIRALIIGFGQVGEQISLQILKTGMVDEEIAPIVIVVDHQAARLERSYRERHAHAPILDQVRFVQSSFDASDAAAVTDLMTRGAGGAANAIYVCLGDDTQSLLSAVAMRRALASTGRLAPPIYCRQKGAADLAAHFSATELKGVDLTRIFGFGFADEQDLDDFTGEALDRRAAAIHEGYLRNFPPAAGTEANEAHRPWRFLAEIYRQSNRDQADFLPMRLACLGLREMASSTSAAAGFDRDLIERAARTEHARWSASQVLRGWRYGPVRDNQRLLHPDLVAYASLDEVGKEKDRAVLRDTAGMLGDEGRALLPLRPIVLELGAQEDAAAAQEALTGSLRADEGAPVIVSRLEDQHTAEVLEAVVRANPGLLWRLVLDVDAASLLVGWPDAASREKARWLINNADQVLSSPQKSISRPAAVQT